MKHDGPLVAVPMRPQARSQAEGLSRNVGNFPKVLDCLRAAGLVPVLVTLESDLSEMRAVVIPGGGDIEPARYGGELSDKVYGVNVEQDEIDLALVAHATEHGLPLLGICRGAQLINVARGGTLYEDLPAGSDPHHNFIGVSSYSEVFVTHEVRIDPSSATAAALVPGATSDTSGPIHLPVRSAHHQCVRELGAGLIPVAYAPDGTIEAFEATSGWTVAVQWHPEAELVEGRLKQGLFSALAAEVQRAAQLDERPFEILQS